MFCVACVTSNTAKSPQGHHGTLFRPQLLSVPAATAAEPQADSLKPILHSGPQGTCNAAHLGASAPPRPPSSPRPPSLHVWAILQNCRPHPAPSLLGETLWTALGTERPVFQEVSTPEDSNFPAVALYILFRWWYHPSPMPTSSHRAVQRLLPWVELLDKTQNAWWDLNSKPTTEFFSLSMRWGEVAQSCPTLCDPMDCSLPGSSVHGIFQARVLEWVAISFSRGSSPPRDRTRNSHTVGRLYRLSH